MTWKLSESQKESIVKEYATVQNCAILGKKYGVNSTCIWSLLKRRGIQTNKDHSQLSRKYALDESYFDKIDTEQKAYFLGLLYADGYHNEKRYSFKISLQEEDVCVIECLKRELNTDRPLSLEDKGKGRKKQIALYISSKKLSQSLSTLGFKQSKSFNLKWPEESLVPKKLLQHFIRGYFDGDGCIYFNKTKNSRQYFVDIISSLEFTQSLHNCLQQLGINSTVKIRQNSPRTSSINIVHRSYIKLFMDWLYKDASIFMSRKKTVYQGFLEYPWLKPYEILKEIP